MLGRKLDILVRRTAVRLLVLDADIRELDVAAIARQAVLPGPFGNLGWCSIGPA